MIDSQAGIEEQIAALRDRQNDEFVWIREQLMALTQQIADLREAGARRNGTISFNDKAFRELKDAILALPCQHHGAAIEDMKLKIAVLERGLKKGNDKWEILTSMAVDIIKQLAMLFFGGMMVWLWQARGVTVP